MRRERIASVFTALAIVLAAVGGGLGPASVSQPASAEFVDCQLNDSIIAAGLATLTGDTSGCYWDPGLEGDYDNVSKTDAYANSLGIKDSSESYTTTVQNFQENSRSVGYSKGKISVVRALENQSGAAQMSNAANQTVRDYYSRMIVRIYADWNAKAQQIEYLNQSGLELKVKSPDLADQKYGRLATANRTLPNGSTTEVTVIVNDLDTSAEGIFPTAPSNLDSGVNDDNYGTAQDGYVTATDPSTGDETTVLDAGQYAALITEAETQSQQITANMDEYAEGVESQYQAGELNATTLYQNDPTLLAQEAGTSFDSTGYYGYSAAQLAAIGYSGDLNQSHVVQINGANYTGTLFYSGAGGTEFQTGQTYDFGNYSGTFYMAASDTPQNETGIIRLDDRGSSFEIVEATNTQTGESVNKTVTQKYVYESANASNLQQEIERLSELREFYEEQASAGGGVGINLGTEDKAIIGVIAAVVLVLALRD